MKWNEGLRWEKKATNIDETESASRCLEVTWKHTRRNEPKQTQQTNKQANKLQ